MSRPRKPVEQHLRDGTYRPSRHSGGTLPVEIPAMPPDLSPAAQAAWNTITTGLERAGLVANVDGAALRLLCESWETYLEASDDVRRNGILTPYTNKAGATNQVVNPAVKVRSESWRQIYLMLRQFGLTPSSRTGLSVIERTDDGDSIADILGFPIN